MSRWWNQQVGTAAQSLYDDPWLAVQSSMIPSQLIPPDQRPAGGTAPTAQSLGMSQDQFDKYVTVNSDGSWSMARNADGSLREKGFMGFMKAIGSGVMNQARDIDKVVSGVPVIGQIYDANKWIAKNMVYQPLDKVASGAYWLYSNAVSQPLTTAILQIGRGLQGDLGGVVDPTKIGQSYQQAKHISPGQAYMNVAGTLGESPLEAYGRAALAAPTFGASAFIGLSPDSVNTNERYLYDTNYWQRQGGWKYTVGTGLLDAQASMYLDPTLAAGKVLKPLKAVGLIGNAVKIEEGVNKGVSVAGKTIIPSRTAEQLTAGKKFTDFAQNAIDNNWSPEQIRIAMERGRGSRTSAFASADMGAQLADALSNAKSVDDWQLAARFAMGDTDAFAQLAQRNQSFALAYGKALDNKVNIIDADNVYSKAYNGLIDNNFRAKPILGPTLRYGAEDVNTTKGVLPGALGPLPETFEFSGKALRPVEDRIAVSNQGALFNKTPYFKPAEQASELGDTAVDEGAKNWQQLAFEGKEFEYQVKPLDPSAIPTNTFGNIQIPGLTEWKAGIQSNLQANAVQLKALADENAWINKLITDPETPAANPLFGSIKEARWAGAGDIVKQAERKQVQYLGVQSTDGFQSRLLQNGVYGATVRFIGKLGDRLPQGVINHNDGDAAARLSDYLKASPLEGDDVADLVNNYSRIGNKADAGRYISDVVMPMVFESMGKKYGLPLDVTQELYARSLGISKDEIGKVINPSMSFSAATAPGPNGNPIRIDQLLDGERVTAHPQFITQTQYNSFLPDLKDLDRYIAKNSGNMSKMRQAGIAVHDIMDSFMGSYNQLFKFSKLFRIGYIARNVTEENLARAAKFGALATFTDTARGTAGLLRNATPLGAILDAAGRKVRTVEVNRSLPLAQSFGDQLSEHIDYLQNEINKRTFENRPVLAADGIQGIQSMDPLGHPEIVNEDLAALKDRLAVARQAQDEFKSYEQELMDHALRTNASIGEGTFVYRGQAHPEPFNAEYAGAIPKQQISSSESYKALVGRMESFIKEDMIRSGNWTTLTPNDPNHLNSWERAVNLQILQDPVGLRVVKDPTGIDALKWLRSPEGIAYRRNLGPAGDRDPREHIKLISSMINQYIPDSIREQAAKNGQVAADDFRAIPEDERPPVHGEELKMALKGDGSTHAWIDRTINRFFEGLPRMASDRLSWQPTYVRAYRMHYQDLIDQHYRSMSDLGKPVQYVGTEDMNKFMTQADKMARQTMREILYEPTRTNLSYGLRYISPFFSAYADSMSRWGGLIMDNPDLVGKFAKIYNAPVAAGLVTDRSGNKIDESGQNASGQFVGMNDRVLNFQVNPLTKNLPGGLKDMKINVGSLNVVTPGEPWWNPGFGPVVSIPADTVMRNAPSSSKFLGWINPYGTSATSLPQELQQNLTPGWAQDLWDNWFGDGQKYQDALMASYRAQVVDYHNNGGPTPDWKKAESDAKNLVFLNALADGVLPGKTRESEKYQFYVDAYKNLQQADSSTAFDQFMAQYGKDFKEYSDALLFTQGATKSKTGIPSTLEGVANSESFKDLIKENPELGGFIVGDSSRSGEFNQWALLSQKASGERTTLSAEDRIKQSQINAGWDAYVKISDAIKADMENRGLTSLQQKGAEDLKDLKNRAILAIANKYEAWARDFTISDRDAVPKRIAALNQIVSDQSFVNDKVRNNPNGSGDVFWTRVYLAQRARFVAELQSRAASGGSDSLSSKSNADIADAWQNFREAISEKDTKFSTMMNRYLANDQLQISSIGKGISQ